MIAMPSWTLRVVFPQPLDRAYDDYQKVVREELETSSNVRLPSWRVSAG